MAARLEIRDNAAIAGWVFSGVILGMLCLMSWVFLRDGGFHQFNFLAETGVMLLFWMFGLAAASELFAKPRIRLVVEHDEVEIARHWLVRGRIERFPLHQLAEPTIGFERDSDGDATYRCDLTLPSGERVSLRRSSDVAAIEALRDRLRAVRV